MAAITLADVQVIAPGIVSIPAPFLTYVNGAGVNVSVFDGEDGDTTKLVRCLLAAHFVTALGVDGTGAAGVTGPETQRTEGGISVTWAAPSALDGSALASTTYGVQAWQLMRLFCGGAWLAEFPAGSCGW